MIHGDRFSYKWMIGQVRAAPDALPTSVWTATNAATTSPSPSNGTETILASSVSRR
jgi:hypothetical protein